MGYTGPVQMEYGARTFFTHIVFRKHIYGANIFFVHFYVLFLTLGTICVDDKDKPKAGCKNQLFKVLEKFLAPNIHHIEFMTYI